MTWWTWLFPRKKAFEAREWLIGHLHYTIETFLSTKWWVRERSGTGYCMSDRDLIRLALVKGWRCGS